MEFGIDDTDLDSAAKRLSAALQIKFALHDSYFMGGDYYRSETPSGTVILHHNYDQDDQESLEAGCPLDRLILSLEGFERETAEKLALELIAMPAAYARHLGANGVIEIDRELKKPK